MEKPETHVLLSSGEFKNMAVECGYAGSVGQRTFSVLARFFSSQSAARTADSVVYAEQSRGNHKAIERAISVPNLAQHIDELSQSGKVGDITIELAADIVAHYGLQTAAGSHQ